MGAVKLPGVPFKINPRQFLNVIVRQISDEMLETLADFILKIAGDIWKIREQSKAAILIENTVAAPEGFASAELENAAIEIEIEAEGLTRQDETESNFTELQEASAV